MPLTIFFKLAGLAGTSLIVLASAYAALRYTGKRGERYSFLSHFISELGEVGVSPAARTFNLGLLAGGLFVLPFMVGLGLTLNSVWGWLGVAAGAAAALGVSAVGLFPMNNLTPHVRAAMTYFRAGLAMVLLFTVAVALQPAGQRVISPAVIVFSLVAFTAYSAFLFLLQPKKGPKSEHSTADILNPDVVPERPRFWILPFMEWLVFFSTIFWIVGAAVSLY